MPRIFRHTFFYVLLVLMIIGFVQLIIGQSRVTEEIPYSKFREYLLQDKVESIRLSVEGQSALYIEGDLKDVEQGKKRFITRAPLFAADLYTLIDQKIDEGKLKVYQEKPRETGYWLQVLVSFVPLLLILFLVFFMINQSQGGGGRIMNFGRARIRQYQPEKRRVTFEDVAGADEEKRELAEIVDFLKDPRKYTALGARIPKGVLLVGPPGTGKTLLARAVAGEAGVPFFSISGSDFVEMFVGVGAARVRDLFETAKKNAPCIVFIDEIDAVGRMRGAGLGGGHDEREQTLNQLLVEMDGFEPNEGIIVMSATNRPDILDPALLRPGRFDRQITVHRPDVKAREEILKVHARNKPLADDVDLKTIARRTPGFTGADLENILNEAALLAARRGARRITMQDVDEAIDRVIAGPAKTSRVISEREKRYIAYHEAGHVIAAYYASPEDVVHKVTIVPRGQAGGYAVPLPKEDVFIPTKSYLEARLLVLLAGRVAEEIVFGDVSVGAQNDFERATELARSMVMEYGMSEKLGPIQFGRRHGEVFLGRDLGLEPNYSDAIAYEIDLEIQRIIREQYERCRELLTAHRDQLTTIAEALLKVETLSGEEIKALLEHGRTEDGRIVAERTEDGVRVVVEGENGTDGSEGGA
ncbi:MAG: ATP-dependent zinc metalloprotease FtsH [Brockia lithotrophica]|nr:ATP-dependent zinc metalloprotease FtsH [Brockia lithotrophica]